jgi:hypothetical protein
LNTYLPSSTIIFLITLVWVHQSEMPEAADPHRVPKLFLAASFTVFLLWVAISIGLSAGEISKLSDRITILEEQLKKTQAGRFADT